MYYTDTNNTTHIQGVTPEYTLCATPVNTLTRHNPGQTHTICHTCKTILEALNEALANITDSTP